MAKRGRYPTPAKILDMRGSRWANERKRHEPGQALTGADIHLTAPKWLSGDAKIIWKQVLDYLKPMGILGKMDVNALARYATLFVEWIKVLKFVEQHGSTIATKSIHGKIEMKIYPQAKLMTIWSVDLLRMEHEFGMTPSARASFGLDRANVLKKGQEPEGKERFFA